MRKLLSICLTLFCCHYAQAQEKVYASAEVKEVTIFASGAELSNKVRVSLPKGSTTLYIQNVANDMDIKSVQLSGPDGITVLSLRQEHTAEAQILNPNHRRLKDSLDVAMAKLESLNNKQKAAQGALKILNNDQLLGGGGKVDLGELSKLVDYYQIKAVELNATIDKLTKEIANENKIIARLSEQIRQYTGNGGQLVVQLNNTKAIQGELNVSYLTYSANWQAYYDLCAKSIAAPLDILYKARVAQFTGVDWKNVKLTLSTGNPAQNGDAPLLNPSYAQFYAPQIMIRGASSLNNQIQNKVQTFGTRNVVEEVAVVGSGVNNQVDIPNTSIVENQLSATFEIDIPYDIASNGQPHSVTLKEFLHPALFKYYAVPKMDKDAFLLAEIKDFEKLNLVPGEANIIFENMFVGTSFINPAITTDTLNLSMGRDKSISIKRERIMDSKSTQVSGGTKRQTYTYEIRVRNNKSSTINMLLKDQYPISTDKSIEVDLVDNSGASVNGETGVLTWKIEVKPGETKTYRFSFLVKHPKDRLVNFN